MQEVKDPRPEVSITFRIGDGEVTVGPDEIRMKRNWDGSCWIVEAAITDAQAVDAGWDMIALLNTLHGLFAYDMKRDGRPPAVGVQRALSEMKKELE